MESSNTDTGPLNAVGANQRSFKRDNYCVCKDLSEGFKDGLFCDRVLIADDGKRIPVHRIVLSAANTYFKLLFTTAMKERGQTEIPIHDVDGDILQSLVRYCYVGEISIGDANVEEMTKAATMLQFPEVKDNCAEYLSTALDAYNCLGIEQIAELHNMRQLKETAAYFAINHFMEVSKFDEFYELSDDQLSALLKNDGLNVPAEEEVLKALLEWIKHDVDSRKQFFDNLLESIRFQYVKETFLFGDIYKRCIEVNCPEWFLSIAASRSVDREIEKPRSSTVELSLVSANSGVKLERYRSRENSWTESQSFDVSIHLSAMVHHDGRLIIMGGRDAQGTTINAVKSIDLKSKEIVDLSPMLSARRCASAELINNFIYIFGGLNSSGQRVRTAERFDFANNKWTEIAPMSVPKCCSAHAVLLGRLYVIGGQDEQWTPSNLVEYYEPSTNKWNSVAPMRHRRSQAAASFTNGFIYVFGGYDGSKYLQSIERYNQHDDSWTEMGFNLTVRRFYWNTGIFSDGDWIYLARSRYNQCFEKININTGEVITLKDLRGTHSSCWLIMTK